jgi:hypothetical protein
VQPCSRRLLAVQQQPAQAHEAAQRQCHGHPVPALRSQTTRSSLLLTDPHMHACLGLHAR